MPHKPQRNPNGPIQVLNEAMPSHKGGCPPMNESGGGANHSWLLSARKRSCSWARITHSAPVTLQFFKRDLIPPSICWQPAGDPHKPGLVLFEARASSGAGGAGPPLLPTAAPEAPSLAPPAPCPASDGHSGNTASLAAAGNTHQGLPDFHPHCAADTHWATSSSTGSCLSRIVALSQII